MPLIAKGASDERNYVKKGVSWALRAIGERGVRLHAAALALAKRLAVRALESAKVRARLGRRGSR